MGLLGTQRLFSPESSQLCGAQAVPSTGNHRSHLAPAVLGRGWCPSILGRSCPPFPCSFLLCSPGKTHVYYPPASAACVLASQARAVTLGPQLVPWDPADAATRRGGTVGRSEHRSTVASPSLSAGLRQCLWLQCYPLLEEVTVLPEGRWHPSCGQHPWLAHLGHTPPICLVYHRSQLRM